MNSLVPNNHSLSTPLLGIGEEGDVEGQELSSCLSNLHIAIPPPFSNRTEGVYAFPEPGEPSHSILAPLGRMVMVRVFEPSRSRRDVFTCLDGSVLTSRVTSHCLIGLLGLNRIRLRVRRRGRMVRFRLRL